MQYVLNSENSQRKTGIYLKLNLGLKALLVINGLMSWVLTDRGDVFRNHSTLWTVRRDLLSLLSEFQLMSNISRSLVTSSDVEPITEHSSLQWGAGEVEKDEVWTADIVTSSLTSIIFVLISHSMLKSLSYINLGKDDLHLKAAIWLLTSRFKKGNIQGVDFIWGPKTIRINSWIYQKVFPANISFITE